MLKREHVMTLKLPDSLITACYYDFVFSFPFIQQLRFLNVLYLLTVCLVYWMVRVLTSLVSSIMSAGENMKLSL